MTSALAVFLVLALSTTGCDWFRTKTATPPSRPTAAALDQLPTRCFGDADARRNLIFLHGILPAGPTPPDLDPTADLTKLAAEQGVRIAMPKSVFPCRNSPEKLCWGSESPENIAAVYAGVVKSAGRCFAPGARFGLIGFSNGGYHVARVVMRCLAPQPAIAVAIGSAGDVAHATSDDLSACAPLTVMVGTQDGVMRDAQGFVERLTAKRAQVSMRVYPGGHAVPWKELPQVLAPFLVPH